MNPTRHQPSTMPTSTITQTRPTRPTLPTRPTRWRASALALSSLLLGWHGCGQATEGGGSAYPGGNENFLAGAAPPPGLSLLLYANHYAADTVRDAQGQALAIPGFKLRANALSPRLVWSTPLQLPLGNLLLHTVLPLVDLEVRTPAGQQQRSGLGDITVGAGWAMHHSPQLHSVLALDLVVPTGQYEVGGQANLGRNYRTWQPLYTLSWIDPQGLNADFKALLNLNARNRATGYRSGREAFVDYSLGWGVAPGWVLGLGGFVTRQLDDDDLNGSAVSGQRTRALALGPSLKFDNGKGWFTTVKWQKELAVRNRPQGSALWVKTVLPF